MAPPDPIQAANASYGVCLPDGTLQGIEILVSTDAAQQPCESNQTLVVGVQDESAGMSYAQPVTLSRQPTNVFEANPLRVSHQQKKTLIALGDALQIWIHQQEAQGNPVDPALEDLALLLHAGRLPDANDPDFQELINKSFADVALDAIVHAVALEADSSPNRALHAQALRYSLQYYCQHNTQNPADNSIRQSLITALANSNNADSRSILVEAQRTANPAVQAQIQQALSTSVVASTLIRGEAATRSNVQPLVANPTLQANGIATRMSALANTAVTPVASGSATLNSDTTSLSRNLVNVGGIVLAGNPASIVLATPLTFLYTLVSGTPSLPASVRDLLTASHSAPSSASSGTASSTSLSENQRGAPALAASESARVGGEVAAFNDSLVLPLFDHSLSPQSIIYRSLRGLGLSDSVTQSILDSLPSPLLLGCASMQGGLHQALTAQSHSSSTLVYHTNHANPAYRVAAISSGAEAELDQG